VKERGRISFEGVAPSSFPLRVRGKEGKMKRILLTTLVIGIPLLGACGAPSTTTPEPTVPAKAPPQPQFVNYVNKEFGFSIDYPKGWLLEKLNPNEIGIKPSDSKYNQIQIGAWNEPAGINKLPDRLAVASTKASLEQFFGALGATNINIFVNERAKGKWDWMAGFTLTYKDASLQGVFYMKDTPTNSYTIILIEQIDWPEGIAVVNSFRLTE
jgi:hypothetical protein